MQLLLRLVLIKRDRDMFSPPEPPSRDIKLVAWKGTQPPGYRVSWMPTGWVVQGSTPLALVIAPPDAPDKNPDVYIGKLVVMLQSRDATAPPADWASQPVNGRPASSTSKATPRSSSSRSRAASGSSSRPRSRWAGTAPSWPSSAAACRSSSPRSRAAAEPALPGLTAAAEHLTTAAVRVSR